MTPSEELRRKWCATLAKLVSPAFPTEGVAALVALLPFLRSQPDAVFCARTLEHVAAWPRRQSIPSLDELKAAFGDWRRTFLHEPVPALPPPAEPERAPPTEAEVAAVSELLAAHRRDMAERRIPDSLMVPLGPKYATPRQLLASAEARLRSHPHDALAATRAAMLRKQIAGKAAS